jgi:hypothetical protein
MLLPKVHGLLTLVQIIESAIQVVLNHYFPILIIVCKFSGFPFNLAQISVLILDKTITQVQILIFQGIVNIIAIS